LSKQTYIKITSNIKHSLYEVECFRVMEAQNNAYLRQGCVCSQLEFDFIGIIPCEKCEYWYKDQEICFMFYIGAQEKKSCEHYNRIQLNNMLSLVE